MDATTIAKDNGCELGKWLHGEAKASVGRLASHAACIAKHAVFHAEAGKIAKAINEKKYAAAEAMLASSTPYASASSAVAGAIMHLKKEAGL